jgi:hypothetical protein
MAELHIDDDWKRQAQEEKRKLAEQEKQRQAGAGGQPASGGAAAATAAGGATSGTPRTAGAGAGAARGMRELPPPSFATLVQSIVTQALYYLGDLSPRGGEAGVNLDMAKHQIDTLAVLEQKTMNNLTPEEKQLLDQALYETRMRYVNVAAQYIS